MRVDRREGTTPSFAFAVRFSVVGHSGDEGIAALQLQTALLAASGCLLKWLVALSSQNQIHDLSLTMFQDNLVALFVWINMMSYFHHS